MSSIPQNEYPSPTIQALKTMAIVILITAIIIGVLTVFSGIQNKTIGTPCWPNDQTIECKRIHFNEALQSCLEETDWPRDECLAFAGGER